LFCFQYINDLERDRKYSGWPSSVQDLLRPTFPGMLRHIRKNLFHMVSSLELHPDYFAIISTCFSTVFIYWKSFEKVRGIAFESVVDGLFLLFLCRCCLWIQQTSSRALCSRWPRHSTFTALPSGSQQGSCVCSSSSSSLLFPIPMHPHIILLSYRQSVWWTTKSFSCLLICLNVCLIICLSITMSVCLWISVCLSVCLSLSPYYTWLLSVLEFTRIQIVCI